MYRGFYAVPIKATPEDHLIRYILPAGTMPDNDFFEGMTGGDLLDFVERDRAQKAAEGWARNISCEIDHEKGGGDFIKCFMTTGPVHGHEIDGLKGIIVRYGHRCKVIELGGPKLECFPVK